MDDSYPEESVSVGMRSAGSFHCPAGRFSEPGIKKLHGTGFRPTKFIQKIAIVRCHGVSFEPYWQ
jgi:hypothetical protein